MVKRYFECLIATFLLGFLRCAAEDTPHIYASIFHESFDGTTDIGGNDGVFSSSSNMFYDKTYRFDHSGWVASDNVRPGAQCVRLGMSYNYTTLVTPAITTANTSNTSYKLRFRAGLWNSSKGTNIYIGSSHIALTAGAMEEKEYSFSKSGNSFTLAFATSSSSDKKDENEQAYLFLDEVTVYQSDATDAQIAAANKLILTGTFTKAEISALSTKLKDNDSIVSIDARTATIESGAELTVGNPNCLVYTSESAVLNNTQNWVKGSTCENLVLADGSTSNIYPFHADYDFTATNVSYDRAFTPGSVCSTVLPFPIKKWDGIDELTSGGSYDGTNLNFTSITGETQVESNQPCLIKTSISQPFLNHTGVNATVKASYNQCYQLKKGYAIAAIMAGEYLLHRVTTTNNSVSNDQGVYAFSNGFFYYMEPTAMANVRPFRCFIGLKQSSVTAASPKIAVSIHDNPSAISKTTADNEKQQYKIYDLNGRYVGNSLGKLQKGLYIVNHKKILVK